ncbi:MAG: FAD-binding oxidoreductase [Acidobacteriia bacterium]|nr:FAD-binding oxidoreductase [Terriglobia bacterium]
MSAASAVGTLQQELASIVGAAHVGMPIVEINGVAPSVSVEPASEDEIVAVMRVAHQRGLVVAPAGGMTQLQIGGIPERVDILLRTARLNDIKHYDPGDLTIGVGAGLRLGDMQNALGEHHQWIPYDPPNADSATIGGLLATAAAGPLKASGGGPRDFCIGVQFVLAEGQKGKGGGRVVKNVAGYDLMKLMIGSYGSLAVITGANFKVFPRPRQTRTYLCSFGSNAEALAFANIVLRSPMWPMCLEIISPCAQEYLCDPPVAHHPDQHAPSQPVRPASQWQVVVRMAGSDNILARCRRELGSAVSRELEGAAEEQFWGWVRQFEYSLLQRHRNAMVMHVNTTIQGEAAALQAFEKAAPDFNFIAAAVGRAPTGNLILGFLPLSVDPPSAMQYANCTSQFRGLLPAGSSAMVAHCPKEAKAHFDVWGTTPTDLQLMKAVKQALDPKNILNRGKFIV